MYLRVTYLMALILVGGCTATYVQPPNIINNDLIERSTSLTNIVLAVERTTETYYGRKGSPTKPGDLESLVQELSQRNIFKEVNFKENLKLKPNLVLSNYRYIDPSFIGIHGEAGGAFCPPYLAALTLFIIPTYCSYDEGVIFKLTNAEEDSCSTEIEISRREKQAMGWFASLFRINPNWHAPDSKAVLIEHDANVKEYFASMILNSTPSLVEISECR